MPLVYRQLHALAARHMRSERPDHTLRATAVVHEAYLRLAAAGLTFNDRVHFYAVAARTMRRILVDHAKTRHREKRGAGAQKLSLDEAASLASDNPSILIDLDVALDRLAQFDSRKADLIQFVYFAGMTYDEAAAALKISAATVDRELRMAKAWLYNELRSDSAPQ